MSATQIIFAVVFFGFNALFAQCVQANTISKSICNEISRKKDASAYLFHDGRLLQKNQPVDLGEMETFAGQTEISSAKESYLILVPSTYTASGYSGNNLGVHLTEMPSWCAKTKQYKVQWSVQPKNFGAGKFEDQFDLPFDGPGNNGYAPVIKVLFDNVVIGLVHGPNSTVEIDKNEAKEFFSGARGHLSFQIRNAGDRNLKLASLVEFPTNPKEIRLKHTDCRLQEIAPASSCTVELELQSRFMKPATPISYGLASKSNDVGSLTTEFHLEYDGKGLVKVYVKLWE